MILKLYFELEKNTLPSDYSPAFLSMIKNALHVKNCTILIMKTINQRRKIFVLL